MEFGGRTTLAKAFAIVEQCDHALCQHDAINLMYLLVDSSKSQKALVATAGLAEAEVDKTTSYDLPLSAGTTYLSDVAARPARERHGIRPGIVRMVNDIGILVVSRIGGNATQVAPHRVMMDLGAQPVMISKRLAQEL